MWKSHFECSSGIGMEDLDVQLYMANSQISSSIKWNQMMIWAELPFVYVSARSKVIA